MMRRLGICLLILCGYLQSFAVDAVVSHSVFYVPDSAGKLQPSVETSWQINPRSLHYFTTPANTYMAKVRTDIVFTNAAGTVVNEGHFILETIPRQSVQELDRHSIIDLRRYVVTPGMVKMRFTLTDLQDSTHRYTYTDSFVAEQAPDAPFYSDLQLLDTIFETKSQTLFFKNGHQQIPAGTNFMADGKSQLHYYTELYKTSELPATSFPLIQRVFIVKREGDPPYRKFSTADTLKAHTANPSWGSIKIDELTSGNYYLRVTLENSGHAVIASKVLFFQRMNSHPTIDTTKAATEATNDTGMENVNVLNLNKTFVAKYTLAQVRAILKMLLPVNDQNGVNAINNFLKKPDEIYMRYYIYNYFQNINKKDPAKAWKDYSNRIKEVNKLFTSAGVPGYETERGFIYLRYGEPTEIINVENESTTLPYEIWQYNELTEISHRSVANAMFLFYRPQQMISGFKLLHSTVIGEMQNPAWRTYLYKSYQSGSSTDSRAEQYIGNR